MNKGATDMPRDKVEILMESEYSQPYIYFYFLAGKKQGLHSAGARANMAAH